VEDSIMAIYEKLVALQNELKAPKGNYNSFGKYRYRSCEDILEAVKPLCKKYGLALTLSDDVLECGGRIYIRAKATLTDVDDRVQISNTALARESADKKGMDESQITGTASSYARKYALNGLFCIDDTKDADTDEYKRQSEGKAAAQETEEKIARQTIGQTKAAALAMRCKDAGIAPEAVAKLYKVRALTDMTEKQHEHCNANWVKVVESCRQLAG
jgi:hypothetical protein